ncbi:hypothetical protein DERF_007312 [Dermatophagoides farinae]|uniref:Uncharacterized protein n=1 Tax=Dermatophagoides farinae TaxID=6954 RepID=A0A922I037_DERFA|nr:hypothetical protein DERF_007312 [Dermatophagoides farinae]
MTFHLEMIQPDLDFPNVSIPGAITPPPAVALGSRDVGSRPNADGSLPCASSLPTKSLGNCCSLAV